MRSSAEVKVQAALRKAGIVLTDIYELLDLPKRGRLIVYVLIDLLNEDLEDERIREGIVRALATREARGLAGPILVQEFYKTPKSSFALLWAIGNTMEVVIDKDCLESVITIAKDRSYGKVREMFVRSLGKIKSVESEDVLIELLRDESVMLHAIYALGKLKSSRAKRELTGLLNHSSAIIRREAQRSLRRIER